MSAEGGGIAPTVAAQLRAAVARLEAASVPGARWDAEILLAFCLGRDRTYLYGHPEAALDPAVQVTYEALLTRRERREPLAYLTGYREFLGLRLQIGPGVLIPRPETEHLVQFAAERLPVGAKILDVGTGSGCVALGVATLRRDVQVTAVDAAPEAIRIARANAEALGLADRVRVELGRFPEVGQGLYQGILSNPPYIPTGDLAGLEPEVGGFEPRLALDGGGDGLEFVRSLVAEAAGRLSPGGLLALEVGRGQAEHVAELLTEAGLWSQITFLPDLAGIPRVVGAIRRGIPAG